MTHVYDIVKKKSEDLKKWNMINIQKSTLPYIISWSQPFFPTESGEDLKTLFSNLYISVQGISTVWNF